MLVRVLVFYANSCLKRCVRVRRRKEERERERERERESWDGVGGTLFTEAVSVSNVKNYNYRCNHCTLQYEKAEQLMIFIGYKKE